MAIDNIGGGSLSEKQMETLKTTFGGDTDKAQKLIDLFNEGEDSDSNGFMNEALDLGFNKDELEGLAKADSFFKGLLDGSLTLGNDGKVDGKVDGKADDTKVDSSKGEILSDKDVESLESEVVKLKKEIGDLDTKINEQKEQLRKKESELKNIETELNKEKKELEEAKEKQAELQKQYDENKDVYNDITKQIKDATEKLSDDMKDQQQKAIYKAMEEYDESKDGNWNSYLNKKLEKEIGQNPALKSLIDTLSSKETSVLRTLGSLQPKLAAQNALVQQKEASVAKLQSDYTNKNDEIASLKDEIKTAEASKNDKQTALDSTSAKLTSAKRNVETKTSKTEGVDGTSGVKPGSSAEMSTRVKEAAKSDKSVQEVKDLVSKEEMAVIDKLGINLSDKLSNGNPRYVIAKGAKDDKYHVYDMCPEMSSNENGTTYYMSVVRKYGNGDLKTPSYNQGMDIISWDNGWISDVFNGNAGEVDGGAGYYKTSGEVYFIDDCDTVKEMNGCYSTASPLSFDLNGDGVKTSDEIVEFDIDGDGVVDRINNSADAVLVFDKDGDGISGEDGSECFGDNTDIDGDGVKDGYKDGFEALKAFARDKGLINDKDDMVLDADDIKYLEENFGFGLKTEGYNSEAKSLTELGITEINLAKTDKTTLEDDFDGKGNQLMTQQGATFVQNGETKDYADIWHRKIDEETNVDSNVDTNNVKQNKKAPSNLEFSGIELNNDNVWMDLLNTKLETEAIKKTEINKFNVFDVDVDKPENQDDEKKKKVDESEQTK